MKTIASPSSQKSSERMRSLGLGRVVQQQQDRRQPGEKRQRRKREIAAAPALRLDQHGDRRRRDDGGDRQAHRGDAERKPSLPVEPGVDQPRIGKRPGADAEHAKSGRGDGKGDLVVDDAGHGDVDRDHGRHGERHDRFGPNRSMAKP
jgi:hypothetical protein